MGFWTSALTGGIYGEGDKSQSAAALMSGYGPVNSLLGGGGDLPNNYDSKGELAKSEAMAGDVYKDAMGQSQWIANNAAPGFGGTGQIKEQTVATPSVITSDQLHAQQIGAPTTLQGAEADQLRSQQLSQAQAAANSPSAAAAQMKSAGQQIANQQLGQAAMARGSERAAMRRDAMLATGTQGMQAANQTAALAASEQAQKQQAYTQALAGVRSGDVSGAQALTQIGAANQGADLAAQQATQAQSIQAQTATGAQALTAQQANQAANLQAQQASFSNASTGWQNQVNAQNQAAGTALQAVGAQTGAQNVAAGYATGQNQAATQNKGALIGAAGGILGKLSDEDIKTDMTKTDSPDPSRKSVNFLDSKPDLLEHTLLMGASSTSDEDAKVEKRKAPSMSDKTTSKLRAAYGLDAGNPLGVGEQDKEAVDQMTPEERIQWAEKVPTGTWRYKPGIEDGGAEPHAGTFAHALMGTGPLGKMFVHERPDGLKEVDDGRLALWVAKAALDKAGQKEKR